MTIGIDASRANKDDKTGTEWYSWHLIEELKKIIPEEVRVVLYTNEKLKGDLGKLPSNWREKVLTWPPKYLWTQIRLWWELFIKPPDVLLVPAHTIPFLPLRKKIKILVNVHDVGFKRFPKLYKPIQVWYHDLTMRKIKSRADLIITISEFSKKEIIDLYGVKDSKIAIVYLGYDGSKYNTIETGQPQVVLDKYQITKPYLLYVGRLEKKKNIGNMVKAFALVKADLPELKLVLAGNAGNQYEEIKKIITDLNLAQEIILPGYVSENDLPTVIRQSAVFLFTTLYEGFGLPILQAMACGTPVLTSNLQPHLEVAGEAGVFADPGSAEEMAAAISKLLTVENFRQEMVAGGLERVKNFSWSKTARDIWELVLR